MMIGLCGRDAEGGLGDSQDSGGHEVCQGTKWKGRGLVAQGQLGRAWLVKELIPRSHLATWQDLKSKRFTSSGIHSCCE